MLNLPTELLRTFIKAVDLGSFTRAGDAVGRTQSAISLQMRRLEEMLDAPLIERGTHREKLTEADLGDPTKVHVSLDGPVDPQNWDQEEDVLDTWASSWLWPFATMGWPDAAEEKAEIENSIAAVEKAVGSRPTGWLGQDHGATLDPLQQVRHRLPARRHSHPDGCELRLQHFA